MILIRELLSSEISHLIAIEDLNDKLIFEDTSSTDASMRYLAAFEGEKIIGACQVLLDSVANVVSTSFTKCDSHNPSFNNGVRAVLHRAALIAFEQYVVISIYSESQLQDKLVNNLKMQLKQSKIHLKSIVAETLVIVQTNDAALLSQLNRRVQDLHHSGNAEIFKPHNHSDISNYFEQVLEKNSNAVAYVALVEGCAAGYILLTIVEYKENAFRYGYQALVVDQICVESWADGLSIGTDLLALTDDIAQKEGISRIEMNYWSFNPHSGHFFCSKGFEDYNIRMSKSLELQTGGTSAQRLSQL